MKWRLLDSHDCTSIRQGRQEILHNRGKTGSSQSSSSKGQVYYADQAGVIYKGRNTPCKYRSKHLVYSFILYLVVKLHPDTTQIIICQLFSATSQLCPKSYSSDFCIGHGIDNIPSKFRQNIKILRELRDQFLQNISCSGCTVSADTKF